MAGWTAAQRARSRGQDVAGGHQAIPPGVEHFGQTGTIGDLYHHYGIGAAAIVEKVNGLTSGRVLDV